MCSAITKELNARYVRAGDFDLTCLVLGNERRPTLQAISFATAHAAARAVLS
jgi:hypothetical protein